jgi:hypothetical protein
MDGPALDAQFPSVHRTGFGRKGPDDLSIENFQE